jgi:hypothetical protein
MIDNKTDYDDALSALSFLGKNTVQNISYAYDSDKNTIIKLGKKAVVATGLQVGCGIAAAICTEQVLNKAWNAPDSQTGNQDISAVSYDLSLGLLFGAAAIMSRKVGNKTIKTVDQKVQESLSNKARLNM